MRPTRTFARKLLGRAFDAVVIDAHRGVDPDVLGQCHGFIRRGGALILRMGGIVRREELIVIPYTIDDVTTHFDERFERCIARAPAVSPPLPLAPVAHENVGTDEQRLVVERLATMFRDRSPAIAVLLSDRGRGKSSALGLALHAANTKAVVTAPTEDAAAEVFRFAPGATFVRPRELFEREYDTIVIDEAAQLPVPLLQRIVTRHPRARIAFATTARGYEGTGRGFVLRFLDWVKKQDRPVTMLELAQPIRWDEGDLLEALVHDALLLDAEPAKVTDGEVVHAILDRERLARDEPLLRDVFGLLMHAHYRTSPGDLLRVLDAPNLALHVLFVSGRVGAVTLIAREGGLDPALCESLSRGEKRIHGHALADTLMTHSARADAGTLSMIRSVRIAVHPAVRRRGLAARLVEEVHRSYQPELFGTMFGATTDLLSFRRSVGYELVRVGVSRGARSGEAAAVMILPVSQRARDLVASLRIELARSLAMQLELLAVDGEMDVDDALRESLARGLSDPPPLDDRELRAIVTRYVEGPQPFDAAAYALCPFVEQNRDRLDRLDPRARRLVEGRVLARRSWAAVAREAGYPSVPSAQRALRPAIAALLA